MKKKPNLGWHFLVKNKLANGDGRAVVPGKWLEHVGPLSL